MASKDKQFYFYVLYCADQTLYGGFTKDLTARLATHNAGKGAKYTRVRKRQPLKMIYAEKWSTKSLAMSAEYHFKRLSRSAKEAFLLEQGVADVKSNGCVLVNRSPEEATIVNPAITNETEEI